MACGSCIGIPKMVSTLRFERTLTDGTYLEWLYILHGHGRATAFSGSSTARTFDFQVCSFEVGSQLCWSLINRLVIRACFRSRTVTMCVILSVMGWCTRVESLMGPTLRWRICRQPNPWFCSRSSSQINLLISVRRSGMSHTPKRLGILRWHRMDLGLHWPLLKW